MNEDLIILEEKLSRLILLCGTLRQENAQLRLELSTMTADSALLKASMAQASARIEALMETLA